MTDWRQKTIDTYNRSAKELAEYFRGIGPRSSYIELAIAICGKKKPNVLEIGCGDGRDAKDFVQRTDHYIGFDISKEAITIARQHVLAGSFHVGDAVSYDYPDNQDVVFAFAAILHLDMDELKIVFDKVHACLKPGGVFYISTKYAAAYRSEIKKDQFGERMFYYYNPEIIQNIAGNKFGTITTFRETLGHTEWFELILQKI